MSFEQDLRARLKRYQGRKGLAVSIKVRPDDGHDMCRSCCPSTNRLIDRAREKYLKDSDHVFVEHETGPELLAYVGVATVALTTLTAAINFFTACVNARAAGRKKGDKPTGGLELIVRGFEKDGTFFEEKVLWTNPGDEVTPVTVRKAICEGIQRHLPPSSSASSAKTKPRALPAVAGKSNTNKRRRRK